MKQIKKVAIAIVSILTVGSGVLISAQVYQSSLKAEVTNSTNALDVFSNHGLVLGDVYRESNLGYKYVANTNGKLYFLQADDDEQAVPSKKYSEIDAYLTTNQAKLANAKLTTLYGGALTIPTNDDMILLNGAALDKGATPANTNLSSFALSTSNGYWVNTALSDGLTGETTRYHYMDTANGVYTPSFTFENDNVNSACYETQDLFGARSTTLTAPEKIADLFEVPTIDMGLTQDELNKKHAMLGFVEVNYDYDSLFDGYNCFTASFDETSGLFVCGEDLSTDKMKQERQTINHQKKYPIRYFIANKESAVKYKQFNPNVEAGETNRLNLEAGKCYLGRDYNNPYTKKINGEDYCLTFIDRYETVDGVEKFFSDLVWNKADDPNKECDTGTMPYNMNGSLLNGTTVPVDGGYECFMASEDVTLSMYRDGSYFEIDGGPITEPFPNSRYTCPAQDYAEQTLDERLLLTMNENSVVFTSDNKTVSDSLGTMPTSGGYMTLLDTNLLVNGIVSADKLPSGYERVSDQAFKINVDDINADGTIQIPLDVKGSSYETKTGVDSTPYVVVVATGTDGTQKFGRLTTSYNATDGIVIGTLNLNDFATSTDGKFNVQSLQLKVFQNEVISANSGAEISHVDYISNGLDITVDLVKDYSIGLSLTGDSIIDASDPNATWSLKDTTSGKFAYVSDIKPGTKTTYSIADLAITDEEFTINPDGTFALKLPNGEYDVVLHIEMNSEVLEKTFHVKQDTAKPVLSYDNAPGADEVYGNSVDMKLHINTASGVKKLELIQAIDVAGKVISEYTTPMEITEPWTVSRAATNNADYKFTATKAGYYQFQVTSNNGLITKTSKFNLTQIADGDFNAQINAVTYSDNATPKAVKITKDAVGSAQWAANRIELNLLSNITGNLNESVKWQYVEFDASYVGSAIPEAAWKDVVDSNGKATNKFYMDKEGSYQYRFRAKTSTKTMELPAAGDVNVLTADDFYYLQIDSTTPNTPSLILPTDVVYDGSMWFKDAQNIQAQFTTTTGCTETLYYRFIDDDGNVVGDDFKPYPSDPVATNNFVEVNTAGRHHLQFMVKDEMDRESTITTAHVNIDFNAPVITEITFGTNTLNSFLNKVTFGTFYKDTITVSATATKNDPALDAQIIYEYVKVSKDVANLDVNGSPQYRPNQGDWIVGRTVNIEEDFQGIVMMRASDPSGNHSDTWFTDGITVDRIGPTITFIDVPTTWSDENSVQVNIKDGGTNPDVQSGIKADSVYYYNQETGLQETLTLDGNGDVLIENLDEGEYTIQVYAEDSVGHSASAIQKLMIDSTFPTLALSGHDDTTLKEKETLTLTPNTVTSGIDHIEWWIDGVKQANLTDFKDDGTLDVVITTNGFYKFQAISGSGKSSNVASVDVLNLSASAPMIDVQALIGSDAYTSGTWTDKNVSLTVKNKTPDLYSLKMYYRALKKEGDKVVDKTPTTGTTITDKTKNVWAQTDSAIQVSESGEYTYIFKAIATNGKESASKSISVYVDKTPVSEVTVTSADQYTNEKWYASTQQIVADYVDPNPAVSKTLEYQLDGGAWTSIAKALPLDITTDGKHVLSYRVSDGLNRVSASKTIYVNIDSQTPSFTYTTQVGSNKADINFTPTLGLSGLNSFTIQKSDEATSHAISGNTYSVTETGTYQVILTSKAGKKYQEDIAITTLSTTKPIVELQVLDINATSAADTGTADNPIYQYANGVWSGTTSKWSDHGAKIIANVSNNDKAGNTKYYINQDGIGWKEGIAQADGSLLLEVGKEATYQDVINFEIKAISESGIESDSKKVTLYIDKVAPTTFSVQDLDEVGGLYKEGKFQNTTQTIKTNFTRALLGSDEWLEYTITNDAGDVIAQDAKQDTFALTESGTYDVTVKNVDSLGRTGKTVTFEVLIDKEIPTALTAEIAGNTFKEFLNNITLGLFFQDSEELTLTADYGVSAHGTIYYQKVEKEADYKLPEVTSAWSNEVDTATINLAKDSYSIYYFYAIDDAGNRSAVYKTDGLTVDSVAPQITLQVPNAGNWSDQAYLEVKTSGDETLNTMAKAINKGFKTLTYTTSEAEPKSGTITFDETGNAKISLHDGSYNVTISGSDYAGNLVNETAAVKVDTTKPTMTITGHDDTKQKQKETWQIATTVGASGYQTLDAAGAVADPGTGIIKVEKQTKTATTISSLSAIEASAYVVNENGTYIFTVSNALGKSVSETIVVNNIQANLADMEITMDHEVDSATVEYVEGSWSASDVTLHVKKADDKATLKYRIGNTSKDWIDSADGEVKISAEGKTTITFRLIANASIIVEQSVDVNIDKTGPNAPYVLNKDNIDIMDTWYKDTVNVKADMDKDVNGCREWIQYSLDNTTWVDGDNFNVTTPGKNNIYFRSKDELGRTNAAASSEVLVKVDNTAPSSMKVELVENGTSNVLNSLTFGFFAKKVDVKASANFAISGAKAFEYQVVKKGQVYDPSNPWTLVSVSGDDTQSKTLTTLDHGFEGVVYVRSMDRAGNMSAIVKTGNLGVDTSAPVINADSQADFVSTNVYLFNVVDDMSGIDKVLTSYEPNGQTAQKAVEITLGEHGAARIDKLPNGEGILHIQAIDKAGNVAKKDVTLKVDTNKPAVTLSFDGTDIKANVNYGGLSGIKDVVIYGTAIVDTSIIANETAETDGSKTYAFKPKVSSTYFVKVTTNAGLSSTESIDITSLSSDRPVVKAIAKYTQTDKKGQAYVDGSWASGNIDVELQNVATTTPASDYFYTIYEADGVTEVQAEQKISASTGRYIQAISETGEHVVSFRALGENGKYSDAVILHVKIDPTSPNTPIITNKEAFEDDVWYNTTQTIKATFKEHVGGASEVLYYNLDEEVTTDHSLVWHKAEATGVSVAGEGKHTVKFRVEKANGTISQMSEIAYVNIDTSKPTDMNIQVEDKNYRHILNSVTFGAFFKETAKVTITGNFDISGQAKIEYAVVENAADDATLTVPADGDFKPYNGSFYVDPNKEVIIFARGHDAAGNVSDAIYSDRIVVDTIEPLITFPDYPGDTPSTNGFIRDSSLRVQAKDLESGMDYITYTATNGNPVVDFKGEVHDASNGIYVIDSLPDGSYYLLVKGIDKAGNEHSSFISMNVDKVQPSFVVERVDQENQVAFTIKESSIVVGPSKVKSLVVNYTNADGLAYSETLVAKDGKYQFTAYENATYTFTLTNGANAQVAKNEVVNLKAGLNGIYVSDFVKEQEWMDESTFTFNAWSSPRTNVLRYSYTMPDGTVNEDTTTMENTHQFNLSQSGKYDFTFTSYEPSDLAAAKDQRNVAIWIDNDIPNAPIVQGAYDKDHWYAKTQTVSASNTKTSLGSDEWIEYRIDPTVDSDPWTKGTQAVMDPAVIGYGRHVVEYRTSDEVGHISKTTKADVNFTNAADLKLNVFGSFDTPVSTLPLTIQVKNSYAPITMLTIRNVLADEAQAKAIAFDANAINATKTYSTNIYENGTYVITAKDASGSVKTQRITISNIQIANDLEVKMRNPMNQVIKSGTWVNTNVTLKATNTLDGSTNNIFYKIEPATIWEKYLEAINVTSDGQYTYTFKIDNTSAQQQIDVKLDKTAPKLPLIVDEANYGTAIWKNSETALIQAKLDNVGDTGSPQTLYYSLDDQATWIKGDIARISGNGTHKVAFKAMDEAGNQSLVKEVVVNLDGKAPIIDGIQVSRNVDSGHYEMELTAYDDHAVKTLYYQQVTSENKPVDGAYTSVTPTFVNEDASGKHYVYSFEIPDIFKGYIYAYAQDEAGNKSTILRSNLVDVDYQAPLIVFPDGDMEAWTSKNQVNVQVDFGTSGMSTTNALSWKAYDKDSDVQLEDADGNKIGGTITASGNGMYKIENLPDGNYRVVVEALNKAGNSAQNNVHVLIDAAKATVVATKDVLLNNDLAQAIKVKVNYTGQNLKPDTLAVRKGVSGEWQNVESYDSNTGEAEFIATSNGTYVFKAFVMNSDEAAVLSNDVVIEDIVSLAGDIQLEDYIKFISDKQGVCDRQASSDVVSDSNGMCTFNAYIKPTKYDVNVVLINWDELSTKMNEKNLKLMSAVKRGSVTGAYSEVTWEGFENLGGSKLIKTYPGSIPMQESLSFKLMSADESLSLALLELDIYIPDNSGQGTNIVTYGESDVLRLQAFTPYVMPTHEAYQIVEEGKEVAEENWVMDEPVTLDSGDYTLYIKDGNGDVETQAISTRTNSSVEKTQDQGKAFLHAITFGYLYKDYTNLTIESDLKEIEVYQNGKWVAYGDGVNIEPNQASIQIRGVDNAGTIVNESLVLQ